GARRVRCRGGRALRQQRPRGTGRLRRRGHRLGAAARLRKAVAEVKILDPATEEVVTEIPPTSPADADIAIDQAARAFESWRAVSPGDRARLLRRFASEVDHRLSELASLEVRNSGHPIGNARWEAGNVRDVLDYYAGAPERLTGRQIPVPGGVDVTFHEPLGVVGVIVPWNFPMPIAGWGFAPALAAG